jgi:hypothetical protein
MFTEWKLFIDENYFSQPESLRAGSSSFFRKSALDSEMASHSKIALSGTISTGVFHEVDVSL